MSDVNPQRDREANCDRRNLYLVSTGPARRNRLARLARSPAHAELGTIVTGAPDFHKHGVRLLMFNRL
jgi:hypothetical protein